MKHPFVRSGWVGVVIGAVVAVAAAPASAEFCWNYVDKEITKAPVLCVAQNDLMCTSGPGISAVSLNCVEDGQTCCCNYNASCAQGGDPSTCCTSIPVPPGKPPQTVLDMHSAWHDCFGNVGGNQPETGPNLPVPPPGRGSRWLAFHRQFEFDFDLYRQNLIMTGGEKCDPLHAHGGGCWIEALDWFPGMNLPYGHRGAGIDCVAGKCVNGPKPGTPCGSANECHPRGCGTGPNRPDNVICQNCQALPQCLYLAGGGPLAPGQVAKTGCDGYARFENPDGTAKTFLADIPTMDEVAKILDTNEHGNFHGQIGTPFPGANFTRDVTNPTCSPRDAMFWRLHKRLDDTIRAWQKKRPIDLSVVIDRSGSMGETDSSGQKKIEVVGDAVRLIASLLPNAQSSRVGVVSFANDGTADLPLTPSTNAEAAVAPIVSGLSARVGGCTSIGAGLTTAATQLQASNVNERKGVILLTDGMENRAPCLNSQGATTPSCGGTCGGGQFDFSTLGTHTQLCAIGFGQAGSLNGSLLTSVAERQGGIYMQSPAKGPNDKDGTSGQGTFIDIKDFFVKCFGQISDEFVGIDPKGTLPQRQLASDPMVYSTCDDERLTFVGGWDQAETQGRLFLLVNTPSGDLVQINDAAIESSNQDKFSFVRVPLPYRGQMAGTWRAQLVRAHNTYDNGFTTDSLPPSVSVPLIRRQIQRLCPGGCQKVLYFEDGHLGAQSSYDLALQAEQASGLLTSVTVRSDPNQFNADLMISGAWDLIVYAHQLTDQPEPFDAALKDQACFGPRMIATDTRTDAGSAGASSIINTCLGGPLAAEENWTTLVGDGRLLEGTATLTNPGYTRFSYSFRLPPSDGSTIEPQGTTGTSGHGAIMAAGFFDDESGPGATNQRWFMDTLVRGRSEIGDAPMITNIRTGDDGLLASIRVLPANIPQGGYDQAVVKVEVEAPTTGHGIGQTLVGLGRQAAPPPSSTVDTLDGRSQAFASTTAIPTTTQTFTMNDNGVNGDLLPGNGQWSVQIPTLAKVDGMYRLRFTADFTKNGCTTHREVVRSTFVEVGVDKTASGVNVTPVPGGVKVDICPKDKFGNPAGWGIVPTCGPAPGCTCTPSDVSDTGDGCYSVNVHVAPGVNAPDCTIGGFGGVPVTTHVAPVITAPAQMFTTCSPAPSDQTLPVTVDHGTLTGAIIAVNNKTLATPAVVDPQTKRAAFPVGTSVVQWKATDVNGVITVVEQTVQITLKDGVECCLAGQTQIVGKEIADSITPTAVKPYCVLAKGGGDFVQTPSRNDLIIGGTGDDSLNSGAGTDAVVGGEGGDAIACSSGGVLNAYGGPGGDALRANLSASSKLFGGPGQDQLVGGPGGDTLVPGSGNDTVTGGGGNDTVILYDDCEATSGLFLDGGTGTDTLITPLSVSALRARGVTVSNFETIVINTSQRHLSDCFGN